MTIWFTVNLSSHFARTYRNSMKLCWMLNNEFWRTDFVNSHNSLLSEMYTLCCHQVQQSPLHLIFVSWWVSSHGSGLVIEANVVHSFYTRKVVNNIVNSLTLTTLKFVQESQLFPYRNFICNYVNSFKKQRESDDDSHFIADVFLE